MQWVKKKKKTGLGSRGKPDENGYKNQLKKQTNFSIFQGEIWNPNHQSQFAINYHLT